MKFLRTLTVLLFGALASSMFAAKTAQAYIAITSDVEEISDKVIFIEDDAATDYTACMTDVYGTMGDPVNLWIEANSQNYSKIKYSSITDVVFKFKANTETAFTMTFSNVEGTVKVKRNDNGDEVTATNDATYQFTCNAGDELSFTVNPSPAVSEYPLPAAVNAFGTFCFPYASTTIVGATFYTVAGYSAALQAVGLELVEGQLVAGQPYVYQVTAADAMITYDPAETPATALTDDNMVGMIEGGDVPAGNFFLKSNTLYQAGAEVTLGQFKAYFAELSEMTNLDAPTAPGRKYIYLPIYGATTGMGELNVNAGVQKLMLNGQLIIMKEGKMFNAQGAAL